jgi:hypothetical protein
LLDEPITRCRFRDCYRKQKLERDSSGVTLLNRLPASDSLGNTYKRGCSRHHFRRPLAPLLFSRAKAPPNKDIRAIRPSISTRNIPGYDSRFAVKAAGRCRSAAVCSYRVRRSFTNKRKSCAVSASRARLRINGGSSCSKQLKSSGPGAPAFAKVLRRMSRIRIGPSAKKIEEQRGQLRPAHELPRPRSEAS